MERKQVSEEMTIKGTLPYSIFHCFRNRHDKTIKVKNYLPGFPPKIIYESNRRSFREMNEEMMRWERRAVVNAQANPYFECVNYSYLATVARYNRREMTK